jgi:tetratricopeptide (TPR) repeat protein
VALAAARRAQALDPLNPYIHSLAGAILDFWGRPEEGLKEAQKALDLDANYLVGLYMTAGILTRRRRYDDALALIARALDLTERAPFYLGYLGWVLATAGQSEKAEQVLAELEARVPDVYVSPLSRAIVHAPLGQLDRAFAVLDESVKARDPWLGCPRMPFFDGFRRDPRFAEHLRRIGHPDIPNP